MFDQEQNAADNLGSLLRDRNTPAAIRPVLQGVIDSLIQADRGIAEFSVVTAERLIKVGQGDARAVARARQQFDQAIKETDPKKAIDGFGKAWESSQNVIDSKSLVISSFEDKSDPFNSAGAPNILTATFASLKDDRGPKDRDKGDSLERDKDNFLEFVETIQDASTGATVRTIRTVKDAVFPKGSGDAWK